MKWTDTSPPELEAILDKFSASIRASIFKFRLANKGIDPDDVLQEIRIKIWKKTRDEKKVRHYSSYISSVINSTLIDFVRKARRADKLIYHEQQKVLGEDERSLEAAAEDNLLRETISEATDSLMESRRKVVKLFLSDLTIDEISLSLDWTKDKTRNLLYRGLSDLKEKLREKGVDYEDRQ